MCLVVYLNTSIKSALKVNFILQFINSSLSSSSGSGVAYAAHIGGFITGIILILFFNNKKTKKIKNIYKGPWEQ